MIVVLLIAVLQMRRLLKSILTNTTNLISKTSSETFLVDSSIEKSSP